jgi:hypothetical protein
MTDVKVPKIKILTTDSGKPKKPIGIVWYATEEDFLEMQSKCPDFTDEGFDAWKAAAEDVIAQEGQTKSAVELNPLVFFKWCSLNGLQPRFEARQRFVHDLVEDAFTQSLKAWKKSKKR